MVALGSVISTEASSSGDLLVPLLAPAPAARSRAWSSFLASSPSVGLGRFLAEVAALGDCVAAAAEAPFVVAAAEAEAAAAPVKDGVMMAGNSGGVDVLLVLVPVGSVRCLLLADAAAAMSDASVAMDATVGVDRGGGASSSELSSITMIADDIVAGRYERK